MNGWEGTLLDFKENSLTVRDPENLARFVNGMVYLAINDKAEWYLKGANETVPYSLSIAGKGDVVCMGIPVRNINFARKQNLDFIKKYFEKNGMSRFSSIKIKTL
jgi:hypothetical protein